jgi:hypothetical protein
MWSNFLIQTFGECDPFFVAQHKEELESNWEIYAPKGFVWNVQFNGSVLKPQLTSGWETLRSHYSWIGNQKLCFLYYGGKKFFMFIYDHSSYETPTDFPYFHTMCTSVGFYPSFYISINGQDVTSPFKVSVTTYWVINYFHNLTLYIIYLQFCNILHRHFVLNQKFFSIQQIIWKSSCVDPWKMLSPWS